MVRSGRRALLTGLSYVVPFAVIGGVLVVATAQLEASVPRGPFVAETASLGQLTLGLVFPVLSGFIAYGIADKPGIAPGFVLGGAVESPGLLVSVGQAVGLTPSGTAGVLGACVTGLLTGAVVRWLTGHTVPTGLRPVYPVLVVPVLGVGILTPVVSLTAVPIAVFNDWIVATLVSVGPVVGFAIGGGIGGMMAWDLGGTVNKVAYLFAIAGVVEGVTTVTAAAMIGGMIPPLGLAAATAMPFVGTDDSGPDPRRAFIQGLVFITEGAIPYVERAPTVYRPITVVGSALGGGVAMAFSIGVGVPHGGILVIPLSTDPIGFVFAVVAGTLVTVVGASIARLEAAE